MISGAITAHFLIGAALIVYLPEAHRSSQMAQTTIIGAVLAGAGIVAWSVASAPWQLFVAAAISGSGWQRRAVRRSMRWSLHGSIEIDQRPSAWHSTAQASAASCFRPCLFS